MKLKIAVAIASLSFLASAQTNDPAKIGANEAGDYIDKTIIVTGKVAEVHVSEKVVRLNLDKPFPKQPFTAVIFSNKTNLFSNLTSLKGSQVEVQGLIAEYRGRPEIIINRTNQLRVVELEKK